VLIEATHCWHCGQLLPEEHIWPWHCASCGATLYQNPLPVAVVLVPVDDGLLAIRRGIEPCRGALALPGGYVKLGESWQEAGSREVFEEAGVIIDPAEIQEFQVRSAPDHTLLIFGLARPRLSRHLSPFSETEESLERVVLKRSLGLAFPLHTQAVQEYFHTRAALRIA
jgi:ADP-ribose pyrophosphatase YjhB (NUDIX family)